MTHRMIGKVPKDLEIIEKLIKKLKIEESIEDKTIRDLLLRYIIERRDG